MQWLEQLAPEKPDYQHHQTGETNADAHLKRTIMGREVVVAITNGTLDFGPWEQTVNPNRCAAAAVIWFKSRPAII
jgi:thiamine phosphate synthase YjbQ (UPF0047 family)